MFRWAEQYPKGLLLLMRMDTEPARRVAIGCCMVQLLESIAADPTVNLRYREYAAELVADWKQQVAQVVVGEPTPMPVIATDIRLLEFVDYPQEHLEQPRSRWINANCAYAIDDSQKTTEVARVLQESPLSIPEIAHRLGVTHSQVRLFLKKPGLPFTRIGTGKGTKYGNNSMREAS